jgi:hypothetical protein
MGVEGGDAPFEGFQNAFVAFCQFWEGIMGDWEGFQNVGWHFSKFGRAFGDFGGVPKIQLSVH